MKFKTSAMLVLSMAMLGVEAKTTTTKVVAVTQDGGTAVLSSTADRVVTIYPTDFPEHFKSNGSAADFPYDTGKFIQTLTADTKSQAGNVTLNTKVDMSKDFTFTGLINLGTKSQRQGGADGVGFLFHPGNTDTVGKAGGAAGIGGVQGAFGFKLDTFYNQRGEADSFEPDPSIYSSGQSFGAFVDGIDGVAKTITDGSKEIPQPNNDVFTPFTMSYNGTAKTMTITYGEDESQQTWSQNVSDWIGDNQAMSFSISASTGAYSNLQQLQNVEFTYTVAQGTVIANYLDEGGNVINPAVPTSGDIDTPYTTVQKDISGYTFKNVTGAPVSGNYQANDQVVNYVYSRNQGAADITYIDDNTGQTLIKKDISGPTGEVSTYTTATDIATYTSAGYELVSDNYPTSGVTFADQPQHFVVHLKHSIVASSENKAVNQTIHYVYENGSKAADDHLAKPVQFTRPVQTDQVTGIKTYGDWTIGTVTTFNQVISPTITGYTPDQSQVASVKDITSDTPDSEITVTYKANKEAAKVTYIDDTTQKTLTTKDLIGDFGTTDAYRTADMIKQFEAQGYELVSDAYPVNGVVYDADGVVKSYEVHLAHKHVETSETKVVNQVIHYRYKNGKEAAADYKATPLQFTRSVTTDQVSGDKTYGAWTPVDGTSFEKVVSPTITGYTPDQAQIDTIDKVTGETADIVKTVTYTADAKPNATGTDKTPAQRAENQLPETGSEKGLLVTGLGAIILILTFGMINLRKKRQ